MPKSIFFSVEGRGFEFKSVTDKNGAKCNMGFGRRTEHTRVAQELGWLSTRHHATCRPGLNRNCSGSSSFAAFVFPCFFLGATAGVAVHSTPLATTVQFVPEQESWEDEGLLQRVQPHGQVAKRTLV